jgi:hypothetical protein
MKKRTWRDHAIDLIKTTQKCPGNLPPTGSLDQLLTNEEFTMMANAGGVHNWNSCHYVEEILGLPSTDDMHEIMVDSKKVKEISTLADPLAEVEKGKKIAELKNRLHQMVEAVYFKDNGSLYVPGYLMRLEDFINKFFNN